MHDWVVGGALIQGPEGLLLVRNHRRGGHFDWSPPGGVIDEGETLLDGLAREVVEETGLVVEQWAGLCYEITTEAPNLGWRLRVEVHLAVDVSGELLIDDPDGIVVDACYVADADCASRLAGNHPWVVEPLLEWLSAPVPNPRSYAYEVAGADLADLVITRL